MLFNSGYGNVAPAPLIITVSDAGFDRKVYAATDATIIIA
jgi:hypothetical protein